MNVHALPVAARVSNAATMLKSTRDQVAEFLGTELPDALVLGDEVRLYDYESGITRIIRERRPWMIINRCAAFTSPGLGGKPFHTVLGVATFTEDMVAGHFPGNPKVPFVDLAKMIANVASIAAALQVNDPTKAPIGVGSDGSSADAKDLIGVPATVLAQVTVRSNKMGMCFFDESHVYVEGEQVGTVTGIKYFLRPSPELPFTN